MSTGALIVLEGADGAGKTVAAKQLAEFMGERAILVREPGGTAFAEHMRAAVLGGTSQSAMGEALAFIAAKADVIEAVVKPALRRGIHVVADRFTRSLLAYQGGLRGLSTTSLIEILASSQLLYMPHLEIVLQASVETRRARRQHRNDPNGTDAMEAAAEVAEHALSSGYDVADTLLFATRRVLLDTESMTQADVVFNVIRTTERYLTFHEITSPAFVPMSLEAWKERIEDQQALQKSQSSDTAAEVTP